MKDNSGQSGIPDAPIEQFLTYRMARVQARLNAQVTRLLKDWAGLTLTQWRLMALIGATGRSTAAQLSRHAAMDKGLISRNIKGLAEEGHIAIIADADDHRLQHLELTAAGRAIFERTQPRMLARQDALLARLDDEEVKHFLSALEKLELAAEDPDLG